MVQIILEINQRIYLLKYALSYFFVMCENILQGVRLEIMTGLQVQELTERQSTKIIYFYNAT